jgi:hypothetical protein
VKNVLTTPELRDLSFYEKQIESGAKAFRVAGEALREIRDRKLYRERHATFEDYCRSRWGMERAHAYRLIAAAGVAECLPLGDSAPASERQVRSLAKIDEPAVQAAVWEAAGAAGGKTTAARVAELTAKALQGRTPEEQIVLVESAQAEQLAAARKNDDAPVDLDKKRWDKIEWDLLHARRLALKDGDQAGKFIEAVNAALAELAAYRL